MIREMLGIAEGILQDLHNDHSEVDTLLGEIQDCDNGAERTRLFTVMKNKLLPHLDAEQQVLYQRLENGKSVESRRFGHEGTSEHAAAEQQVRKMLNLGDPMSDRWNGELKVLIDLIEHHVGEEESTGFSCARDEFDTEQLEAMREEFQTRKAQLGTQVA
ncbi:MAG TPA: hemerythrin domain-containing protein [Stellaceae bacterium]|jgi:hemerythrin-like domain-containing protein|nr:hemerythrin domain-containing protein [Stellaceae bacterium]